MTVDLADRGSIRAAVDRIEELHGRLDGAFNNGAAIQQVEPNSPASNWHLPKCLATKVH